MPTDGPSSSSEPPIFPPSSRPFSPWHDFPLHSKHGFYHVLCLTPRGSAARIEISADEDFDPLRPVACATGGGGCGGSDGSKLAPARFAAEAPWNLGIAPQTWQDPESPGYNSGGGSGSGREYWGAKIPLSGTPVEVIEIGAQQGETGQLYAVKPLSAIAVVAESCDAFAKSTTPHELVPPSHCSNLELPGRRRVVSWTILAISLTDPRSHIVNDVADLAWEMPGELERIKLWVKTCCGVPASKNGGSNKYVTSSGEEAGYQRRWLAFDERAWGRERAIEELTIAHQSWQIMHDELPAPAPLVHVDFPNLGASGSPDAPGKNLDRVSFTSGVQCTELYRDENSRITDDGSEDGSTSAKSGALPTPGALERLWAPVFEKYKYESSRFFSNGEGDFCFIATMRKMAKYWWKTGMGL
ncbi:unnamed protein product [Closterium sp. Yama58-4]|nr:unnamed protein product [Closterium sp. Yama58-4]